MTALDKIEAGVYLITMADTDQGINPLDEAIRILTDIKFVRENIPF
jgi:hypothetical protein